MRQRCTRDGGNVPLKIACANEYKAGQVKSWDYKIRMNHAVCRHLATDYKMYVRGGSASSDGLTITGGTHGNVGLETKCVKYRTLTWKRESEVLTVRISFSFYFGCSLGERLLDQTCMYLSLALQDLISLLQRLRVTSLRRKRLLSLQVTWWKR